MLSKLNHTAGLLAVAVLALPLIWATPGSAQDQVEILGVDFPPYEFENPQDGLPGFDVEVVEEAFNRVGYDFKLTFLPWKRAMKRAAEGKAAGLISCGYRKAREEAFAYTAPISAATRGFYTRAGYQGPTLNSYESARDQKVGVVLGYTTEGKMKELNIPYDVSPNDVAALRKLDSGRIDLFLTIKENTDYLGRELKFITKLKFHAFKKDDYHLCISRNWPGYRLLVEKFNRGLRQVRSDGTYTKIHSRYRAFGASS